MGVAEEPIQPGAETTATEDTTATPSSPAEEVAEPETAAPTTDNTTTEPETAAGPAEVDPTPATTEDTTPAPVVEDDKAEEETTATPAVVEEAVVEKAVDVTPVKHHLIDGDLDYKGFGSFLQTNDLDKRGEDYSVIAVFGGQSSGKSTLLNRLFGTAFQEMDSETGRGQTTQGVWMSKAKASERLVVLDFEGTDSAERGEDQTFEKKLSTFALAMADVLMINLFQTEIGRRNAMSVPLLEQVLQINFEIQMQLAESKASGNDAKKMLLFVIRDYDGRTPIAVLNGQLTDIMESVWEKLNRPEGHRDDKLTQWFDFKVKTVPHLMNEYLNTNGEVDAAVDDLRHVFLTESNEEYVFKCGNEWRCSGVMINELDRYSNVCWGAIKENKAINIPGEKELVARHRSGEVVAALKATFVQSNEEITGRIFAEGAIPGVAAELAKAEAAAVAAFEQETRAFSRYQNVLDEMKADMKEQFDTISTNTLDILNDKICGDLATDMRAALSEATVKVKGSFDFTPTVFWAFLRKEIQQMTDTTTRVKLAAYVTEKVLNDQGRRVCEARVEELTRTVLRDFIVSKAAALSDLMGDRFLYVLTHSENGNVRSQKESELDSRCPEAYAKAMLVLEALSVWRYDAAHDNVSFKYAKYAELNSDGDALSIANADVLAQDLLVSQQKLSTAYTRFCAQMKGKVLEARLSLDKELNLPPWVYLVFAVLGFNEAIWLLSNPLFIVTLLFLLYFFAKSLVRTWYVDMMENGPLPVRAALLSVWPYLEPILKETVPNTEDAPKSAADKKND